MQYLTSLLVCFQMIRRDIYVFKKRLYHYGINYLLILPVLTIIAFGYIQPGAYFGPGNSKMSAILLVGTFTSSMINICSTLLTPFLYDLEAERFIDYQLLLLPPHLLLLEIMLFPAIISCLVLLPFFPLAYAILPTYFSNLNINWVGLCLLILTATLCSASYIMLAFCIIKNTFSLRFFWLRFNWPLLILGGFWIPWHVLKDFSVPLAYIALANPFTYMTEGLRSTLIGAGPFIPYWICVIVLLSFFCIFSLVTCYFFKKKLDHV